MTTLATLKRPGWEFEPNLDLDDPVPVLTGPQAQGDIYILPASVAGVLPATGDGERFAEYHIIEGQGIRNPHTLVDLDGDCRIIPTPNIGPRFDVATLVVPDGGSCFLVHPEHGGNGIGPGRYVIRRQREQADEIRAVAD